MNTNDKGKIAELIAQSKFIELGYTVLQPINKDGVYDFVIEKDCKFFKIQVKSITIKNGVYILRLYNIINRKAKYYLKSDVDYFVGVDINTKDVFKIPFSECGKNSMSLRINKPINNQKDNIKYALDYKL